MVQFDSLKLHSDSLGSQTSGNGWMAGPYAAVRLTENVFLRGRAAWGRSSNDVSPFLTYSDTFTSRRWLLSASLTGSWRQDAWSFKPLASIGYMEDTADSYTDTFGAFVPQVRSRIGQAKIGPEFGYRFQLGEGTVVEPHAGVQLIWDYVRNLSAAGFVDSNGDATGLAELRGKADLGLRATLSGGVAIDVSGSYDGIGSSGLQAVTGQAAVRVPLD